MKKITWMEIAIAMPMVLTFSSFGGLTTVVAVSAVMLALMALAKWGWSSETKNEEVVSPVRVNA